MKYSVRKLFQKKSCFIHIEEPLRVMNTERLNFEFSGEMKAITLRSEPAEDYFHIIMPMQME